MFKKAGDVVERNKSQMRKKEVRRSRQKHPCVHVWLKDVRHQRYFMSPASVCLTSPANTIHVNHAYSR